jgi:hypothetical protein
LDLLNYLKVFCGVFISLMLKPIIITILFLQGFAVSGLAVAEGSNPVRKTGVHFTDETASLGLKIKNAPATWVDFDNDGWIDLYAAGTLWKNNEGKRFTKIKTKLSGTAVAADADNDGFKDFFSISKQKLFRNIDGKGFEKVELPYFDTIVSQGACWADFDNNGYVDLYIGGYENWKKKITYPDMVLLNQNGTRFCLDRKIGGYRARGVTACNFDQDNDVDVYVCNYRLQPNLLLINNGEANFQNAAEKFNARAASKGSKGAHSIGAVWADFNNDGWFDLFIANFAHKDSRGDQPESRFLRNKGPQHNYTFKDLGTCGIYYQESYATCAAGDYDNDGDIDLFITTVYGTASFGKKNHPVLFRNDGNWKFTDVSRQVSLEKLPPTYQAAWGDFDNDGDLDLVTAGKLFVNHTADNHWLKIKLYGDGNNVNSSAIGSQVRVTLPSRTLSRQVEAGTGQGNQNELTLHFGLGKYTAPLKATIFWANGRKQSLQLDKINQIVEVKYENNAE